MKKKMINLKELSKEALISMIEERDRKLEKADWAIDILITAYIFTQKYVDDDAISNAMYGFFEDSMREARKALNEIRGGGEG